MDNIEKEIRLKVTNEEIDKIISNSLPYKKELRMIDITMGKYGFESLKKVGYICRVRCKGKESYIEVKKYINEFEAIERSIKVESLEEGIKFLNLLGYEIYLILDRYREVRKYNNLLLYIDKFDDIGNYLEIEYQESNKQEVFRFIEKLEIDLELQDKYGDIVCKKLNEDENFKNKYIKKLRLYNK